VGANDQLDKAIYYSKLQLDIYIDIYKHHVELFWKWTASYMAIVSALFAYIFKSGITQEAKHAIPFLLALVCAGIAFGCYSMWRWLTNIENGAKQCVHDTDIKRLPHFLGIDMTFIALVVACGFSFGFVVMGILWAGIVIPSP
jgi:hypothetical protein